MLGTCTNFIVIVTWTLSFFGEGNRGPIKIFQPMPSWRQFFSIVPATTTSSPIASPAGWATCHPLTGVNIWRQFSPSILPTFWLFSFQDFPSLNPSGFAFLLFWSNFLSLLNQGFSWLPAYKVTRCSASPVAWTDVRASCLALGFVLLSRPTNSVWYHLS